MKTEIKELTPNSCWGNARKAVRIRCVHEYEYDDGDIEYEYAVDRVIVDGDGLLYSTVGHYTDEDFDNLEKISLDKFREASEKFAKSIIARCDEVIND